MSTQFTRREMIAIGAKASVGIAVLGRPLLRASQASATTVVRRDVGGLSASGPILASYRTAIQAMKALPDSDPRSWTYQAAIHGTFAANKTAWNTCEHGSYWFWPWHRMYLYYFERIVRSMSRNPGWTLPFWNYGAATERQLPAPFRDPSSALYTPNRGLGWNSGSASLPGWVVDPSAGFGITDFTNASASIENIPHGNVHGQVGGWMGQVPTAAQDPIFFLHHANIDRLWNLWLAQGGGRTDPLSDSTWKNRKFTFFDEKKNQVQLKACDVLRCAQQLNYTYENEPPQVNEYCFKILIPWKYLVYVLIRFPLPPIELSQKLTRVTLDVRKYRDKLFSLAASKTDTILLKLEDVVTARPPGAVWQVYLGAPKGAKLTPDGPFFVGTVAMFGMGIKSDTPNGKKFMPASFTLVADRAVQAGLRANPNGFLPLSFVPAGPLIKGRPSVPKVRSAVRVGKVSLTVLNQKRR
jgi:hypothetical protein